MGGRGRMLEIVAERGSELSVPSGVPTWVRARCQGRNSAAPLGLRAPGTRPAVPHLAGRRGGRAAAAAGAARGRRGRGNEAPAAVTEALTFTPAPAAAPFRASWSVWETQTPAAPPAHQVTGRWALLPHTSWAE